jgi:ATP-dependent Clp endopeptidase proteolytic subunit ClpP
MSEKKYYAIQAARQKDSADIYIYEPIGSGFFSEGVTAKQFVKDLNALDVKTINLHINSPGGSVFEAMAIYNALKEHPANVITNIDGVAASAATFVALSGDTVVMAENAMYMIHNPWSALAGSAEDLRKEADVLDKLRDSMVSIYMSKFNGSEEDLLAALDAETWYSAEEAAAAGFIDVIKNESKAAASLTGDVFASFGYKNAPINEDSGTTLVTEENPTTEGDEVDNTVTPAEAVETVEAAKSVTANAVASSYSVGKTRTPITSAAAYIEHKVRAAKGDFDSQGFIRVADADLGKFQAADTAGNTGLVHDSWLNEIITTSLGTTAAIDAVGVSPLMETGLTFKIPKVTQYPTAATTAEGATASTTSMETDDIDVSIVKKAGRQVITFELFDRSTPSFYQEVLRQIQVALGKNKDEYLLAQLVAGGTAASTTAGTIAGLQSFIATETSAALSGSGDFADMLLTSPDWWTTIKAAKDTTGRGLYNAINPMNANGRVTPQSLRGDVEGMNLYVDPFLAANSGLIDNSALILTGQAARYWESPIRQIQINNLTDGAIEVEYYQYVAAQVVKPAGVRKFNLT